MAVAVTQAIAPISEEVRLAEEAGLHYVRDNTPGITRRAVDGNFVYYNENKKRITDEKFLRRIRALVIPPAWTDVWICPDKNGHIQATGRDAKGRKQYRYHAEYRALRDTGKFTRLVEFGEALPALRRVVRKSLCRTRLNREKILAVTLSVLEGTGMRIGNEEYVKQNGSFGLTTLTKRHVKIRGESIRFTFKAKSGQMQDISVQDRRIARILKQCSNLPGQQLFQYKCPNGDVEQITSGDVNELLRQLTGQQFTAKDFRTWLGTLLATRYLKEEGDRDTQAARKKVETETVKRVAAALGNRPATCRKYYIHPGVLESYLNGNFFSILRRRKNRQRWRGLEADEKDALKLAVYYLERKMEEDKKLANPFGL